MSDERKRERLFALQCARDVCVWLNVFVYLCGKCVTAPLRLRLRRFLLELSCRDVRRVFYL